MLELDNSKRSQFVTCPRKYYYSYERNLRPSQGSTALRYGIVYHAAMDAFYNHVKERGWTHDGKAVEVALEAAKTSWEEESSKQTFYNDYRTMENFVQSLMAYISHFHFDEGMLEVVKTERPFKILLNGRLWQLEHKTTGQALSMQKKRLHRSPQLIGYAYAGQRLNPEDPPEGGLVTLHHLSAYKSKVTGEYGKAKIQFERIPQMFTEGDFISWRLSFLDTAERILRNKEINLWAVELDHCYQFGRCSYAPLCEQNAELGEEILWGFHETEPWNVAEGVELTE
jgi:hypothetical protein